MLGLFRFCLATTLCLLCSCAGYRYAQVDNPLRQYGVDSLSVPMFFNYSSVPEVSSSFTRETYKLLSSFSGLKVYSGWSSKSDATLIGIIRSRDSISDVMRADNLRVAQSAAPEAVGTSRPEFYVPGSTSIGLVLQVVVIKSPTKEEIEILQSELGPQVAAQGRVIFNEIFHLNEMFLREIFDGESTSVIATQNAGALRRTKDAMAVQAAQQIRDMIFYAF
jgi:hypothetical protein